MKKSLFKSMVPTIALILVGLLSLTGITYAWFTSSPTANLTSLELGVVDGNSSIKISATGLLGSWVSTLAATDLTDNGVDTLDDVSTAGAVNASRAFNFYDATISAEDGSITAFSTTSAGFYSATVYLLNEGTSAVNVSLSGSTIEVGSGAAADSTTAARVALVEQGEGPMSANTSSATGVTLHTAAANCDNGIWEPVSGASYKGVNATAADATEVASVLAAAPTVTTQADTATFITIPAKTISQVTIYVWIEGQDVDCVNQITGVPFTANLKFAAAVVEP